MNENEFPKLDRTKFSVVSSFEEAEQDNVAYWRSRSLEERLEHVELLRRINYGDAATARLQRVLRLLKEHDVRYLLIGGYAVGYHGYARATENMDIWVAVHPDNAQKLVATLKTFGLADPALTADLFLQTPKILRMGFPPMRLEITTSISGVEFDDCYKERIVDQLDGVEVNVIDLENLKKNKKASGRAKDSADIERLS